MGLSYFNNYATHSLPGMEMSLESPEHSVLTHWKDGVLWLTAFLNMFLLFRTCGDPSF